MNKRNIAFILLFLFILLISFILIKFSYGQTIPDEIRISIDDNSEPVTYYRKDIEASSKDTTIIPNDVKVQGNIECNSVKSKTTDLVIIGEIILGIIVFGLLL